MTLHIRPALDSDGPALATIMALCFLEFPGCYFEAGENKDVQQPACTYLAAGGIYYVAVNANGQVVGGAGLKRGKAAELAPIMADWEVSRVYVSPRAQGQGVGSKLLQALMEHVPASESRACWSDTRFVGAHRFYQAAGFTQLDHQRALYDLSDSQEYAFSKSAS